MLPSAPTSLAAEDRAAVLAGARSMLGWLVGIVPFGLVVGVTIASSSIPPVAGWLTGPLVFAGSAQLAVVELLDAGALPAVVVLTVLVVNARLLLYSTAIAPMWRGTSLRWRLLAGSVLVDPSFAVASDAYRDHPGRPGHLRYAGSVVVLWIAWVASITTGMFVGSGLPPALHLELAVPLYLVGHVVHADDGGAARWAVAAAALAAVTLTWVPLHLDLFLAIALGMVVGTRAASASSREADR